MIGREFGHYRIVEYLGGGGMGVVYKALDRRLERPVAVKFLHESWVSDSGAIGRFHREARTASGLSHPNICVVHDFGESEGRYYLVMEWLDGATLQRYLTAKRPGVEEILEWSIQLSDAVNYAHAHGVIHRDLKPANVFVMRSGQIKILDFGLAKPIGSALSSATAPTAPEGSLTNLGTAVGTVGYMSPEQARGEDIDGRSDVFSLGAVMYEMVARRRAFAGETQAVVYDSILNRTPSRVRQYNPNVPVELDDIILRKALEKDPSLRYQSAADLGADLKRLKRDMAQGKTSAQLPSADPEVVSSISRRRFAYVFFGGIAVGFAMLGAASFFPVDQEISRVAVLPFTNTVEDKATDFLTRQLTDSVRNALSDVPGLNVYSSVAVSAFQDRDFDLALIRDELPEADAIVQATVSPNVDGAFTIQVESINPRNLLTLGGDTYPFVDPLEVQERIARDITFNLRGRLSGEDQARLEILGMLEEARSRWERRNETELSQAKQLYRDVISRDPQNATAYAGLALVYAVYPIYSQVDPAEYARLAVQAAGMARELAAQVADVEDRVSLLADAHNALALVAVNFEHDWDRADREYSAAIELDPDNPTTYQWRAEYLTAIGQFEDALRALDDAERVDPLSLVVPSVKGWVYLCAGRLDEAIDQLVRVLDREPDFGLAHRFLGQVYIQEGDYDRALETLRYADQLEAGRRADIAYAEARGGNRDGALQILNEMLGGNTSPYDLAIVHAGLGDTDAAIRALEEGVERGSWELVNLNVEPQFEPIRSDSRFAEILARLELQP